MTDIPIVITSAGLQPVSPDVVRAAIIAYVTGIDPGYTATLPGSLIEDICSTDVGAILQCNAALVELVNSLTPYGANVLLLNQLGTIQGIVQGTTTATSVSVVFSNGSAGTVIPVGFTVSDGTYQYTIQDGGVVESGGSTASLFCLATIAGSWTPAANSVTTFITQAPASSPDLTVTNPLAGTPGGGTESEGSYRARALQANLATSTGTPALLKTALGNVSGVQQRLIALRQQSAGGWEVIVGGGDPYAVANAIYNSIFDFTFLVGSVLGITAVTKANPGVVTTNLNHGYTSGQMVTINDVVGMIQLNGNTYTATVTGEKTFSIGIDTTGFTTYTSGGVVTPNLRNQSVNLQSDPDTYTILFVTPPQQTVGITLTWSTTSPNFVSPNSISLLANPAILGYINMIQVGLPINLLEVQSIFQVSVASVLATPLISNIAIVVTIDGIETDPQGGTELVYGDPESYFQASSGSIVIVQG